MAQNAPFDAVEVTWTTPVDIAAIGAGVWEKIRIYRSNNENLGYELQAEIDSQTNGLWKTYWHDENKRLVQKDYVYYLVRYYTPSTFEESKYYLTIKTPTPRELRLIGTVRGVLTPFISKCMTDEDVRAGLILSLNAFNIHPPITNFNYTNLPDQLEPIVTTGSAIFTLMYRYLGIAFTDISYSDMGLSLNIDRGAKINTAISTLMGYWNSILPLAKMEYAFTGTGVGTVQLPVSLGYNINRGILNVFDLFTSIGR